MNLDNSTLDAIWCIDSETSEEVLLERKTGKVLARRDRNGIIPPIEGK